MQVDDVYLFFDGHEALEFLEPVLNQDHFDDRRGLLLFELDHEKSIPVVGQIIAPHRISRPVSGFLKEQARLAGHEAGVCLDIHDPHLILPSVEKLFAIPCPQWLNAPFARYLVFHTRTREGPHVDLVAI